MVDGQLVMGGSASDVWQLAIGFGRWAGGVWRPTARSGGLAAGDWRWEARPMASGGRSAIGVGRPTFLEWLGGWRAIMRVDDEKNLHFALLFKK